VLNDQEHVEEYQKPYPPNVVYQAGANFAAIVASGSLPPRLGPGRWTRPT
jgi:hypothetical protein